MEVDWVGDELRVLLHNLFDLGFLEVLLQTVLDVEDDPGTASNPRGFLIQLNGEGPTGTGLPDVLL